MGVAKRSLATLATQLVCLALAFASAIVLARVLGPEKKGVVTVTLLAPALAAVLFRLDLGSAVQYLAGRKPECLPSYAGAALAILAASGGAALLATLFLHGAVRGGLFPEADPVWFPWALAGVPLLALADLSLGTAVSEGRMGRYNAIQFCLGGLFPVLVLALVLGPLPDVGGVVVALLAASAAGALLGTAATLRAIDGRPRLEGARVRELLSFGGRSLPGTALNTANVSIGILLLGCLSDARTVGIYSIAALAEKLSFPAVALKLAIVAPVASSPEPERSRLVALACRVALWLAIAGALVLAAAAPWLLPALFGEPFRPALHPFWILLTGQVAISIAGPLTSYLGASNRPGLVSVAAAANLAVAVGLGIALVPEYGAAGAAWAASAGYLANTLVLAAAFLALSHARARDLALLRREDMAILARSIRGALGLRVDTIPP
ncbi:MAG: polysaccharide biosynthesis C-terminal domain-containing protein [Planctomycetes bacterium]|nr:polysaccharide biosynthesis C-terminal domain-containing protein [Planctomycetota bacterium]